MIKTDFEGKCLGLASVGWVKVSALHLQGDSNDYDDGDVQ